MKKDKKCISKWMYWFSFALALILVYKILDSFADIKMWFSNLFSVLSPFIVGIIIAYILYIPSRKFEQMYGKVKFIKKRARPLSVFTVYVLFILLIIIGFRFLVPAITTSFQDLVNNFQSYYISIKESIMALPEDSIFKSERFMNIINRVSFLVYIDMVNN